MRVTAPNAVAVRLLSPSPGARPAGAVLAPPDRIAGAPPIDGLARAARPAAPIRHAFAGSGVTLATSSGSAAAIAAGRQQISIVDGVRLAYPSQDLTAIESAHPDQPGQTHALERHIGTTLAQNVARLTAAPLLRAAGSYTNLAAAQFATDRTVANPANQSAIGAFLADPGRIREALQRVDLGRSVGSSTLHADVAGGTPRLVPGTTATVVLIKDASFPEGYRVLTTYPDTRRPEVDARGNRLS